MKLTPDSPGQTLAEGLKALGIFFGMPCGGQGACGKCAVLAQGALGEISEREQLLLARLPQRQAKEGFAWRMACLCPMVGDCQVLLPEEENIPSVAPFALPQTVNHKQEQQAAGAAVDLGTTTVSLALYDLTTGALLAEAHEMNRQAAFGADVLCRIDQAARHGMKEQQACIQAQVLNMLRHAQEVGHRTGARVRRMVVTGNTTMLHLFAGLDPTGIGIAPFQPKSLFGNDEKILDLPVHLPRCVSAYVGADITCGILATSLCSPRQNQLLVDVGTNGEMALFTNGKLLCCATAAGPAFEGAQISMGMAALSGAVYKVEREGQKILSHTIGGGAPRGICGTGLISAIRLMLDTKVLDGTGKLLQGQVFALGQSGISLTQQDIRHIQLAKAAIAAGIDTLLHEGGLQPQDVNVLYLSGGFGNYLLPQDAAAIGLIPAVLVDKVKAAGNSALSGASELLLHPERQDTVAALASAAQEVPLATNPYFMEKYIDHMAFEE